MFCPSAAALQNAASIAARRAQIAKRIAPGFALTADYASQIRPTAYELD
jgi:hypothetical protein